LSYCQSYPSGTFPRQNVKTHTRIHGLISAMQQSQQNRLIDEREGFAHHHTSWVLERIYLPGWVEDRE
jgi:hypothetical protein